MMLPLYLFFFSSTISGNFGASELNLRSGSLRYKGTCLFMLNFAVVAELSALVVVLCGSAMIIVLGLLIDAFSLYKKSR